jgi:hypothetical protein
MPRGAKPGERRGGREKGVRNKATIEKAIVAERVVAEAQMHGKKLGKETMQEYMELFTGLAASFQPTSTDPASIEVWAKSTKEPFFEKYAKLACACAEKLAQYQSPKIAPVQVVAPPPEQGNTVRKKFTVSVFENGARAPLKAIDVLPASTAKH